jgi:hypothetical protein
LDPNVYIADPSAVADASELMRRFGDYAADEAAARARRSRGLGNVIHFCRWRQVERMIQMLSSGARTGQTIH